MKKLIPVCILLSACALLVLAAVGLTCTVTTVVNGMPKIIGVPIAIAAFTFSLMNVPFAVLFKRDRLCYISVFIGLGAAVVSGIAVILWLALL